MMIGKTKFELEQETLKEEFWKGALFGLGVAIGTYYLVGWIKAAFQ